MTDEAAILAAVLAHPDDDTPRLAYADWCDDNGQPERAALIRAQVGQQKPACRVHVAARQAIGESGQQLLEYISGFNRPCRNIVVSRGRGQWQVTAAYTNRSDADWRLRPRLYIVRGFLESVTCPAADWLAHGDAILAAHPVRRVRLTTWPEGSLRVVERQRAWRQPPRLGGHVLDCWRAEWPGVEFELPPT